MSDKCPKCGAALDVESPWRYHCGSSTELKMDYKQSDKCRIRELDNENQKLTQIVADTYKRAEKAEAERDALKEVLEHIRSELKKSASLQRPTSFEHGIIAVIEAVLKEKK